MPKIQQPSNQIKLTNVSIVRLKKGGKRFEIACYKNKVQEWRNRVETVLDDVLQISNVFTNVSKGEVAKTGDLQKAFGHANRSDIVKEILETGEVQVGEKERDHDLTSLRKEIATLISEKCVNSETQKPYPTTMIEKAMDEAGFSVKQNKTAKGQVSDCIKLIQTNSNLPIQRARMKVKVIVPVAKIESLKEKIVLLAETVEKEETGGDGNWQITMLIDPQKFKDINVLLQKECKGSGILETISFAVTEGI